MHNIACIYSVITTMVKYNYRNKGYFMKNKQLYTILLLSSLKLLQAETQQEPVQTASSQETMKIQTKERKELGACVLEATDKETLQKLLTDNGFKNIADAFGGVKSKIAALIAFRKLDEDTRNKLQEVATKHQQHLMKILAL